MHECTVCGERDFEEQDGLYFCTTCNTQSQDVRVMLADDENLENFRWSGVIREPATPKQRPQKVSDDGRPWSVYEVYQIIIKEQVEALIQLGASEQLREMVFKIWVNYVSQLGIAFSEKPINQTLQKYDRQREKFPGTTEKPKVKNVLGRKSRLKTCGMSAKKAEKQMEKDQTVLALQDEEFYEGDNPVLADGDEEAEIKAGEWSSNEEEEEEERWGRYRKNIRSNSVEKVRMVTTLGVCFLGLMYTNPSVTATDLIRWVRTSRIPYLDVSKIIPGDMKFGFNDWKYFGQGFVPSLEQLRYTAGTIAYFLKLDNFPEFQLDELINKYIIQLDLPAEFHGFAMNLRKSMDICLKYVPTSKQKTTMYWEGIAMAYIVIMLKMLFGLDDSTEIILSDCSRELMEISQSAQPLFVWTDWIQHMKNKMHVNRQTQKSGLECEPVIESLSKQISHRKFISNGRLYRLTYRESIAKPLEELSDCWKSKTPSDNNATESFLGNTSTNLDLDIYTQDDTLQSEGSRSTHNDTAVNQADLKVIQDIREKSDKFRQSSLQHIISPDTFLYDLHKRKISEKLEENSGNSHGDIDAFSLSEVIISNGHERGVNLSKSPRAKKRRRHSNNDHSESFADTNMAKYEDIVQKLLNVKAKFEIALEFDGSSICLNYDWLVKICCQVIDCKPEELKAEILKLELIFLVGPEDPGMNRRIRFVHHQLRKYGSPWMGKNITKTIWNR